METEISKKAIVVDTNLIVELKDNFQKTIQKLSEKHDVFVTEISINERISQKYLEMEKIYQKIDEAQKELKGYASINTIQTFDKRFNTLEALTKKAYSDFFGNRIIPFQPGNETLNEVLKRVYRKTPPFSTAQGSSDKGFKDTLLWISIINYFKEYRENNEIIFITSDKGFINNEAIITKEFCEKTKRTIEIKTNEYLKTLLGEDVAQSQTEQLTTRILTDKEKQNIRQEIVNVFNDICNIDIEDWRGEYDIEKTFLIYETIDVSGVKDCLENLKVLINEHIFDESIHPSDLFFVCTPNIEDKYGISIDKIENLFSLFQTIKTQYGDFLIQFFKTACEKINNNYQQKKTIEDNEELPF